MATSKTYYSQPAQTVDFDRLMSELEGMPSIAPEGMEPERTWGDVAQDVGITALKSAIAVPETVVGMADMVSGGRAGKLAEEAGFRPKEAKAILDEGYSDQQKAAFKAVQDADGFGGKLKAAVQNPSVVGHTVLESAAPMLAGGVVAKGLMGTGVMTRAISNPTTAGMVAGAIGEGVTMAGGAAEQIRQQTEDGYLTGKQAVLAAATGVAGTVFAVLGGRIAQKFGFGDVDTMLAGVATNPAAAKGVVRSTLEAAFSEGVIEELPQSVLEQVLQNEALGRPLEDGVDQAAVLGMLAGGAIGAGANVVNRAGASAPEPAVVPPSGPMGRAAAKAPAPVSAPAPAPLPMPDPEQAQALLAHANERARQIDEKAKGTKDQKITTPDGKTVTVPGRRAEFLTPDEKEELALLKEHGGDAAVLAGLYPDVVATAPAEAAPTNQSDDALDMVGQQPTPRPVAPVVDAAAMQSMSDEDLRGYLRNAQDTGVRKAVSNELTRRKQAAIDAMPDPLAAQPVTPPAATEAPTEVHQAGDILNVQGEPFKNRLAASKARKEHGGEVVAVAGGWVVRPAAAPATTTESTANDQPADAATPTPDAAAADAVGSTPVQGAEPQAAPGALNQTAQPSQSMAQDLEETQRRWTSLHARAAKFDSQPAMLDAVEDFENGGEEADFLAAIERAEAGASEFPSSTVDQASNVQDVPQQPGQTGEFTQAAPQADQAPTPKGGDAVAAGTGTATGDAGAVEAHGVKRSMGRYGEAMTITQADARVKELEKEARESRKAATDAPTKLMESTHRERASRASTLARQLREDIKDTVGAYPDARAEFESLKATADGDPVSTDPVPTKETAIDRRNRLKADRDAEAKQEDELSNRWPRMTTVERAGTATRAGMNSVAVGRVSNTEWSKLDRVVQDRLEKTDAKKPTPQVPNEPGTAYVLPSFVNNGATKTPTASSPDGDGQQDELDAEMQAYERKAVKVPADVDTAITGQMQKQKVRLGRLKSYAERSGMTLDEKLAAQTKVKAAEATLRKMRQTVFDAEDAAIKAIETGNITRFAEHEMLFPDVAEVLKGQIKVPEAEYTLVGRNSDGKTLMADKRGVRSYSENGIRIEEAVSMRPVRGGGMELSIQNRRDEFRTAEEIAADQPAATPAPASPAPSKTVATPSANTIFTEDAAAAARALLKKKLSGGTLNSGIDPELLQAGITLAGYHIEKGARKFAAFARAMVDDLGDGVKPYLKSWYMAVAFDPRAQAFNGMDDVASVAAINLDTALENDGASVHKNATDSVSMVANLFGDGPQRQALIEKGFDGVGVDVQQRVLAQMRSGLLDLDVRRAVVEAVPGNVMRVLIPSEIPTALLLRNETVLADAFSVSRESSVPVPVVGVIDALVAFVKRKGALSGAEVESSGGDLGRPAVRAGTALGAIDGGQGESSQKMESTLVQSDPRTGGLDGTQEVSKVDNAANLADTGGKENGRAIQQLDQPGAGALGGAPAQDVRSPEVGGDAGASPDGRSRGDRAGNARADDAGGDAAGGLGAGSRAVPVSGRGTRAGAKNAKKPGVSGATGAGAGLGDAGRSGGLTPETGANPAPNAPAIPAPQPSADDFTLTADMAIGEGGQKTKFKNNVAAIRLVRELEETGRMATPDEQLVLAKYVGWGGLPQAFDPGNADWAKEHAEITALMSADELAAARRSTRYAHYTSREIIVDGVYAAMRRFGFTGGKTLEAGAGVGNFIGMMPADMRSAGRFTAIEREPFSSAIARQLYPQQNVQRADFTEFKGNDGYYDAAVGNPPFASDAQTDRSGRKHLSGLSLHNYFFAKSIDMLREGGVMAQVVTNSFMDAKGDKARRYMSDRVEFLGAIRLPNSAFAKNANTEVTTDIVFLKKRPDGEIGSKAAREDAKRWLNTGTYTDKNGKEVALNQYFIDNPHMMLGDFGAFGTMYGPDQPALVARPGQDTLALLKAAIEKLPANIYKSVAETGTSDQINAAVVALKNPEVKEGGYFVRDGKLLQRLPDIAGEARGVELTPETQWTAKTKLGEQGFERIKALSAMRGTVRQLLAAEMADDDKGMTGLRKTLNEQYDAYRKTHGLINDPGTLRYFEDDPDFPLLASLEHGYTRGIGPAAAKRLGVKPVKSDAKKGPIFSQRVVAARRVVQKVQTPADALAVSMAERGRLDAAYIGQLLGMDPEGVLKELSGGDKPLLFRDPVNDEYVLRDAYLSGNVRAKLAQAKQAGMFTNVTALEAVQPPDVASHEIVARLGSPWVPTDIYAQFAQSLYGPESTARVSYVKANSSFALTVKGASAVALSNTWGTSSYAGDDLLQAVMNNRTIKVTYRDQAGKTHTDAKATEDANNKAQEIRERFNDWLFSEPERSEILTKAYNETNNNYVTRVYDGSPMTFPGKVPDSVIKFRRHQRNAIARIVQDRTALLDHVVGAGKTFTVVSASMELKRTGLARKPMVAVPNHLVKQWAADFYRLYPGANVLTATKKDFERANRRKFLAKIATGDWDAVVIAHSSFGYIAPSPEFETEFNSREIQKIMATIQSVEDGEGEEQVKKRTVKQLEGMKERLEKRIERLRDKPMDDLLDFEQIGVDQLFVDEAHMFKNLMYSTKMQGVSGLNDKEGSQRAYDMYVKTNQVMEKNGRGQGVVFATGTPVSNSLAEMYHMMRYLMPAQMRELGFESFDAWANTFASVEQVWMQAPSGDGFKAQNRMNNFVNTPELLKMFDQVSDTVTMDDIKRAYAEENNGAEFPLPKLKGGRRTPVSLDKSPAQDEYMGEIAKRAKAIEQRKGPPQKGQDNILVVMSDARKAAMDIRLVDLERTDREVGGRIDRATDEVLTRYRKYDSVKGTQIVFSDLGTPLKHAKKELAQYEALQARILAVTEDVQASATLGNEAALDTIESAEEAQAELDAMGPDWLTAVKTALRGFSVYDDFKAALIEKGIPEAEIAFIHDYNTDDQKASLFAKVNAGQIRVLLGSTAKLGAGTNVQERLVAEHHLDVPWRPSDVEQREGRIERQGNRLMTEWPDFEIEILAYVTKDTLDMRMWQVQEAKLKMINQLRTRKIGREIDNAFEDMELSAGEMQAAATGDINLLKEIQLRADVKKLEQRRRSFDGQRNDLITRKRRNADALRDLPAKLAKAEIEATAAAQYLSDRYEQVPAFKMNIDGKDYSDAKEAQAVLRELDDATIEVKALNGEVATKKAPLSVTIDGELIKSRATMADLFADARGDADPIVWKLNGHTYHRRSVLATGMRQKVLSAMADENVQQLGTLGAYAVAIEGSVAKDGTQVLDVTLSRDGQVVMSNDIYVTESEKAPARIIQLVENLLHGAVSEARYLQSRLEQAKKDANELAQAKVADEWPDQPKLDAARAAHKDVLATLKQKNAAAAPSDGAEGAESLSIDDGGQAGDTAAYGPASQKHRDAVAQLNASFAKRVGDGSDTDLLDAVAPIDGAGNGGAAIAVRSIARQLFAREVVFVKFKAKPLFNGVVSRAVPGHIFINIDSQKPLMVVLGHELLHELAKSQPGIYANLSRRLDNYIQNETDYAVKTAAAYQKAGISLKGLDTREELEADIVGDNFANSEFWAAMAKDQPGLFRRIAQAIIQWIDGVVAKASKIAGFDTEQYLTDITAARAAVADAMRQFSAAQVGAVADNVDGPESDGVTLSIANDGPINDPRPLAQKSRDALGDLFNHPNKLNWWHKSVGTQYNLAQKSKAFKRVFDRVQDFLGDVSYHATEAADQAPNILPKLDTWRDIFRSPLTPEDSKAIAAPIFEGTLAWRRDENGKPVRMSAVEAAAGDLTVHQKSQQLLRDKHITERTLKMWQGLPMAQFEAIIDGKFERELLGAGIVWSDAELVEHFNLTPKQIELYREFRNATDKSLTTLAISDMLRFGGSDVAALADEAMAMDSADEAAMLLRDFLLDLAEVDTGRRDLLIDTANKMVDKADKVNDLIGRGYAPLSRFGHYSLDVVDAEGERVYFGLFESQAEANKMARAMRSNFDGATIRQGTMSEEAYKLFAGVSPETLELFGGMLGLESGGSGAGDKVFQEYLKLAKGNRSAMKRLIERKGIAGFSEDAGRVLAGFIYSNARQVASGLHMGAIAEAASAIPAQQGELKDAALKLVDYIKNPVEEASKFRGLLFAQYLGGSIASAMVNMMQPLQVTIPYLSQFGGVRGASMEMKRALVDVLKKSTGDKDLDEALRVAEEEGIVAPQEVHQLMAQAQGSGTLKAGDGTTMGNARAKASNAVSKMSLAWGKAFGAAEQFNRRLTFIASYRLAKQQGMKNPAAFAEKTIAETQFIYNKGNKPRWARGAIGGTLFTFKQYSIAYMELLARMATAGAPGSPERAAGRKAALMAVGVLLLMGGAGGLPFVEDLEDLIDALLQRLGYNVSAKQKRLELLAEVFGQDGARFVDSGISGLPGAPIDVSGRLGLGNLIPGTGLLLKKDNHSRDMLEVAGPAGDLIGRAFKAANQLASGDVGKAVETISPVAARNLTKAIDMANTGMYRDDRGRKVLDTDGYDALAKGVGFQPGDVARVQEGSFAAQKMIALNKQVESEIAGRWAVALFEGDKQAVAAARQQLLDWNRKNPHAPIRINMSQVLKRVRAMNQSKADRIAATAPKEIRANVRRELEERAQ